MYVSTLRRFVEAVGGELEIVGSSLITRSRSGILQISMRRERA
jgi:hypothetical protein